MIRRRRNIVIVHVQVVLVVGLVSGKMQHPLADVHCKTETCSTYFYQKMWQSSACIRADAFKITRSRYIKRVILLEMECRGDEEEKSFM